MEVDLTLAGYAFLLLFGIAGWAIVYAQKRSLEQVEKLLVKLGIPKDEADDLTDADVRPEDIVAAMEMLTSLQKRKNKLLPKKP